MFVYDSSKSKHSTRKRKRFVYSSRLSSKSKQSNKAQFGRNGNLGLFDDPTDELFETDPVEDGAARRRLHKKNTSGHTGVCWNKSRQKWMAYIYHKDKFRNLGYYDDKEGAATARKQAEYELQQTGKISRKQKERETQQIGKAANRRKRKTSNVCGVTWHKQSNKWRARISYNGKQIFLGHYNDINEAIEVRRQAEHELQQTGKIRRKRKRKRQTNNSSGHTGVYWHKKDQKWQAEIMHNGEYSFLGQYDDIKDAIEARKQAERELGLIS